MLIGISGKINSGKDTVGKIIQILDQSPHFTNEAVIEFLDRDLLNPTIENKKFADTLKNFICMLLGCTREQLEDREFKEKELGKEWWYWERYNLLGKKSLLDYESTDEMLIYKDDVLIKPTPRLLLQLMGTECGRDILHCNIWVNALFSNYLPQSKNDDVTRWEGSNWIITDMRFPNELQAIENRGGVTIRVNRKQPIVYSSDIKDLPKNSKNINFKRKLDNEEIYEWTGFFENGVWYDTSGIVIPNVVSWEITKEHPSETALDNAKFDLIINNDGTLNDLVNKIRNLKEVLYGSK